MARGGGAGGVGGGGGHQREKGWVNKILSKNKGWINEKQNNSRVG